MTHREALDESLDGSGLHSRREHAALVALCRTLAKQMDAAGDEPSTRLTAAYLSCLKDVRRAITELPPVRTTPNRLDQIRAVREMPRPSKKTARDGLRADPRRPIALQEGSTAAALAAPNTADNPYGPS